MIFGNTVKPGPVQRYECLKLVERVVTVENLGDAGKCVRGRENSGAATMRLLVDGSVRSAVGPEEEPWIPGCRCLNQRNSVCLPLGYRETIVMGPDAPGQDVVSVDQQVVGGDGRSDPVAAGHHVVDPVPWS